jgi:soluble lytic murein transglycosylase
VARKLLDEGDVKRAYRLASDVAGYGAAALAEAEFHAGWIALRFLGDAAAAERHFARMAQVVATPISRARAYYWLGRAYEAAGARGEAHRAYATAARYGTAFYGQLSLAKLGVDRLQLAPTPQPTTAEHAAFDGSQVVQAVRLLAAAGRKDLAATFFAHLSEKLDSSGSLVLLAQLAESIGEPRYTLLVGKTAVSRGFPLEAYAYPTNGIPQFQPVGPAVDGAVVHAIARQESAFNAQAVSRAGARGLMQLMPQTAKATASSYGLPFSAPRLTQDAAYNAQIGAAHLGELVGKHGGSYIMTFAAYNAGQSRVSEWVGRYGDPRSPQVDLVDWIERIPFAETRNYVQRVFENMQIYRARLGGGAARLSVERDLHGSG